MTISMNDSQLNTLESLGSFINGSREIDFKGQGRKEVYSWVGMTLKRFNYGNLSKGDKGTLKQYLEKVTGYSRAQVTRLTGQFVKTGQVKLSDKEKHRFSRKYTKADVELLAKTDRLHNFPNGNALKVIIQRMAAVFSVVSFLNLAKISVSHIYNLRGSVEYRRINQDYTPTKPAVDRNIGVRAKPQPDGKPGYIRVDSVHQGDLGKTKGVYHVNTIDEVTQMEVVGSVEQICETYLVPLLEELIKSYPFKILEFHSDNGSEYINHRIADLLNRLLIKLTKSRARRTNDNALVEGKNGSVIRKWLGYGFIPQRHAGRINRFYFGCFNEYLNYHRPCGYPTEVEDGKKKGKIKKIYRLKDYQTPYQRFKGLKNAKSYLREGATLEMLEGISKRYDDNQMAQIVQKERDKLFDEVLFGKQEIDQLRVFHRSGSLLD